MVQINSFIAVPAMLVALCEIAGQQLVFPHVRQVLVGGGTPADGILHSVCRMFPAASIRLSYAMTEACTSMTFRIITAGSQLLPPQRQPPALDGHQLNTSAVCVGRPAAGVEVDIQQGDGLPPGSWVPMAMQPCSDSALNTHKLHCTKTGSCILPSLTAFLGTAFDWTFMSLFADFRRLLHAGHGIIQTRGPHVMLGYWSAGGSTLRPQPDRWLSTGDIGREPHCVMASLCHCEDAWIVTMCRSFQHCSVLRTRRLP